MAALYNELDAYAAQWLRSLIQAGHIADGEVLEQDIQTVEPRDLEGFTQVHLFAGIGVWSYALRLAGWPDDRPVWTASCPCQPFSDAGSRKGFNDDRHLWPKAFSLIAELRPAAMFGEQVASTEGRRWIDVVADDLEGQDYTFGALDLCPSIIELPARPRLFFSAYPHRESERPSPLDAKVARVPQAETPAWREPYPGPVVGVDDGVSHRLDRLRVLGNAVVPAQAEYALRLLLEEVN